MTSASQLPHVDFSAALLALKAGHRVAREGWNGNGMWLVLMPATVVPAELVNGRTKKHWPEGDLPVGGYIVMRTAQGTWQPGWLASQTDLLSEDWVVL